MRPRLFPLMLIILALLAFIAGSLAGKASASGFVRTEVYWNGPECIMATTVAPYDASSTWTHPICSPIGAYVFTESNIWPGDWAGIDPIMGDAVYIECRTWFNGRLEFDDSAHAGDGTDVNCLGLAY